MYSVLKPKLNPKPGMTGFCRKNQRRRAGGAMGDDTGDETEELEEGIGE